MRIGFLSDCHGNYLGLEAAYNKLKELGADQFYCLGDIVGYGSQVKECLDFVRKNCQVTIAGNHDYALVGKMDVENYHDLVQETITGARSLFNQEELDFFNNLPLTYVEKLDNCVLFLSHAHPTDYENWCYYPYYDLYKHELEEKYNLPVICFYGHTHKPSFHHTSAEAERQEVIHDEIKQIPNEVGTWIINIGSCGQPRDRDIRASCVLFDTEKLSAHFIRVAYDVEATKASFEKDGIPAFLTTRLLYGQ